MFYVKDVFGLKITQPGKMRQIQRRLSAALAADAPGGPRAEHAAACVATEPVPGVAAPRPRGLMRSVATVGVDDPDLARASASCATS